MQVSTFGKGMARALAAAPPLPEPRQRRIVPRHLGVEPPDFPSRLPQPDAQLRLFSGDQGVIVPAYVLQRLKPHQRIAATGLRLTHRRIPFRVDQGIIDRRLRETLPPPAADDGDIRAVLQKLPRGRQPSVPQHTVPVKELDEARRSLQRIDPGIPGAGRGEGTRHVQRDHRGAALLRFRHGPVCRSGIDVDDLRHLPL